MTSVGSLMIDDCRKKKTRINPESTFERMDLGTDTHRIDFGEDIIDEDWKVDNSSSLNLESIDVDWTIHSCFLGTLS